MISMCEVTYFQYFRYKTHTQKSSSSLPFTLLIVSLLCFNQTRWACEDSFMIMIFYSNLFRRREMRWKWKFSAVLCVSFAHFYFNLNRVVFSFSLYFSLFFVCVLLEMYDERWARTKLNRIFSVIDNREMSWIFIKPIKCVDWFKCEIIEFFSAFVCFSHHKIEFPLLVDDKTNTDTMIILITCSKADIWRGNLIFNLFKLMMSYKFMMKEREIDSKQHQHHTKCHKILVKCHKSYWCWKSIEWLWHHLLASPFSFLLCHFQCVWISPILHFSVCFLLVVCGLMVNFKNKKNTK